MHKRPWCIFPCCNESVCTYSFPNYILDEGFESVLYAKKHVA